MEYENDSLFTNCFPDPLDAHNIFQNKEGFLGGDYQREMFHVQKYDPIEGNINKIFFDSSQDSFSLMGLEGGYSPSDFNMMSETRENVTLISEDKENISFDSVLYPNVGMQNCTNQSPNPTFTNFPFNSFNPELEDLLERSVENNFDNVRYANDGINPRAETFSNEGFISCDMLMKPEITEIGSVSHCSDVSDEYLEEKIIPLEENNLSDLSLHKSQQKQYINCNRVKCVKQTTQLGQPNTVPHIVQFTTYPAVKKITHKSHIKIKKTFSNTQKVCEYMKEMEGKQVLPINDPTNVVLPVGTSGFQVSIPSSAPINVGSFSSNNCEPGEWQTGNDLFKFSSNSLSECGDFDAINGIKIKVYTGFEKNKRTVDNNLLKLTKKMVLESNDWDNCSAESERLSTIDIDDSLVNSYPVSVQRKISRIVSCLKSEVKFLTDDVLNRLSIPVSTVKRGYLKPNELVCLKKQINILNLLQQNNGHKKCLIFSCKTCQDVKQWRIELHELQKWRDTTGPKSCLLSLPSHSESNNINNNAMFLEQDSMDERPVPTAECIADRTNQPYFNPGSALALSNPGSKCSAVFLQNNEVFPVNVSMFLNNGSIFHVKQLDIGNVSVLADDDHNAIKLYFIDKSLLYEIELQIESSEKCWHDVRVFYINIEVPFTSVCHLQSQKELEIELLVRETPTLLLAKKCPQRTVIQEKDLPLSSLQGSLITSIRSQLVLSPFHKLQVTESNFNRVKCCFINSCGWLDSPFVNNAERSLSETPKDWVINEFSLDRKNLKAEMSKCKTRKVGRPPKRTTRAKRKAITKTTKDKNSLKSIVLINIFSSDPLTNPNMENAKSDELVWVAEQSTLKDSGWSKS